jgi:uncharacterized membrane protein
MSDYTDLPRRPRRWLWVALGLSLTLNLAFLGGFLYLRGKADGVRDGERQRVAASAQDLGLSPSELQGMITLRREIVDAGRRFQRQVQVPTAALAEAVMRPTIDRAEIDRLQTQIGDVRAAQQREIASLITNYALTVAPERRMAVILFLRQRAGSPGQPAQRGGGPP